MWAAMAIAVFLTSVAVAQGSVSSQVVGFYDSHEKPLLAPAFINAVNAYLRRYEPRLIDRGQENVRMQANYDYLYDIDLIIKSDEYEIVVTLAERTSRQSKPQKLAAHLSAGVLRAMQKELIRSSRGRARTNAVASN